MVPNRNLLIVRSFRIPKLHELYSISFGGINTVKMGVELNLNGGRSRQEMRI